MSPTSKCERNSLPKNSGQKVKVALSCWIGEKDLTESVVKSCWCALMLDRSVCSGPRREKRQMWHYELDICTYMYTHVCVCTHTSVRVCVCMCVCAPTPTRTCAHAHIYTHIYVARWVRFGLGIEFQMLGKPIN